MNSLIIFVLKTDPHFSCTSQFISKSCNLENHFVGFLQVVFALKNNCKIMTTNLILSIVLFLSICCYSLSQSIKSHNSLALLTRSHEGTLKEMQAYKNECLEGWFPIQGMCYIFVGEKKNWYDAKNHCNELLDSHLISIHDQQINDFIMKEISSHGGGNFWLGLFRVEEHWNWEDEKAFDFNNFGLNDVQFYAFDTCGLIMQEKQHFGKWLRKSCKEEHQFICMRPKI